MGTEKGQVGVINPQHYLEQSVDELGRLAIFAKACNEQPVVVLIDGRSPWATQTKKLLSEVSIQSDENIGDGFLKGCSGWEICEIAARSAPTIAEHVLATPTEPSGVRIVMFYQTSTGLRIACTDICLGEFQHH